MSYKTYQLILKLVNTPDMFHSALLIIKLVLSMVGNTADVLVYHPTVSHHSQRSVAVSH